MSKIAQYWQWLRKTPSIKTTLVVTIFMTVGATAAIIYIPWSLISKHNVDTIVDQVNNEFALGISQEVERLLGSTQSAQQLLRSSLTQNLLNPSDPNAEETFLLNVLQANPDFTWVQYGRADGDFIGTQRLEDGSFKFHLRDWDASSQSTTATINSYQIEDQQLRLTETDSYQMEPAFYAPDRPWYQSALQTPGATAWEVYVYRSTQAPGMDTVITLQQDGEVLGVVGVGIELTQLSEYLKQLQDNRPGAAFIIDTQQHLIASTDPSDILSTEENNGSMLQGLNSSPDPLLQYANESLQTADVDLSTLDGWQRLTYQDPQTGDHYLISLTPLEGLDWVVGTVIPEESYLAEVNRNKRILLIVISGFTLVTAFGAVALADFLVTRPILGVAHAAAEVEAGKFELTELTQIEQRTDEIGRLARIFCNMAQEVYQREKKLKKQVTALQIEINQVKRSQQVKEIVDTDFFQDLTAKAKQLRNRNRENKAPS